MLQLRNLYKGSLKEVSSLKKNQVFPSEWKVKHLHNRIYNHGEFSQMVWQSMRSGLDQLGMSDSMATGQLWINAWPIQVSEGYRDASWRVSTRNGGPSHITDNMTSTTGHTNC